MKSRVFTVELTVKSDAKGITAPALRDAVEAALMFSTAQEALGTALQADVELKLVDLSNKVVKEGSYD